MRSALILALVVTGPAHAFVDRLPNADVCVSERAREQRRSYRRSWLGVSGLTTLFSGTTSIDPVSKKSVSPALATLAYVSGFVGVIGAIGFDEDLKVCGAILGQEAFSPSPSMLKRRKVLEEYADFTEFYADEGPTYLRTQIALGVLATSSALMINVAPTRGNKMAAGVLAAIPLVFIGLNYFEIQRKRDLYTPHSGWTLHTLPHAGGLKLALELQFH